MNAREFFSTIVAILILSIIIPWSTSGGVLTESYRGFYVFGPEVRTFQPCGSKQVYWVKADQQISQQLRAEHQKLTSKPYDSIYIEVSASLTGKATVGFAADYDGLIVIEAIELIRARQKGDCALSADTDAGIIGKVWKYDSGTMKFTK